MAPKPEGPIWTSPDKRIAVFRVGLIEVGPNYRHVQGYSHTEDGRLTYPWVQKTEALKRAKARAKELVK